MTPPSPRTARPQRSTTEETASVWPPGHWKATVRRRLLRWYAANARTLSWRASRDPYRIWVSEIMLQQTTTATVEGYYPRFLEQFPTVATLAAAPLDRVLRMWEGLGYYRRARQLHLAAQKIVTQHGGEFPTDPTAVRALPGIGRYTAGAILSIACDAREPILEANTIRLFSRLLKLRDDPTRPAAQRVLWQAAEELLPREECGAFNQALMDLGSQVCKPRAPLCSECPLVDLCPTYAAGLTEVIPALPAKVKATAVRHVAVVVRRGERVLLVRQPESGRWGQLWDFVRFDEAHTAALISGAEVAAAVRARVGQDVENAELLATLKHGVTRWKITLDCYTARASGRTVAAAEDRRWVSLAEIGDVPLSSTGRSIVERLQAVAGNRLRQKLLD